MESDLPKKARKVDAPDRTGTKKSDGPATKKDGEHPTHRVEYEARSEQGTSLLRLFDDTIPSQFPAGYQEAAVVVEDVRKQWIQIVRRPP